jgi:ribosomal 30S subunit maturation factor RimM
MNFINKKKKEKKLITEVKKEYRKVMKSNNIQKNMFAIKLKGMSEVAKELDLSNLSVIIRNIQMEIMREFKKK